MFNGLKITILHKICTTIINKNEISIMHHHRKWIKVWKLVSHESWWPHSTCVRSAASHGHINSTVLFIAHTLIFLTINNFSINYLSFVWTQSCFHLIKDAKNACNLIFHHVMCVTVNNVPAIFLQHHCEILGDCLHEL